MVTEKYRDEFGVILHHKDQKLLELRWFKASARMTDIDFMRSMERYADLAQELRTPFMLVTPPISSTAPAKKLPGGGTRTSSPATTTPE
jgi:hypothetical protein